MATHLLFSFEMIGAPEPTELPQEVEAAMGTRPRRELPGHVWQLDCKNNGDARNFVKALGDFKAEHAGFHFYVLMWNHNSPDVHVKEAP